jgi:hypothetical protein
VALATRSVDPVVPQEAALGGLMWEAAPLRAWAAAEEPLFAQHYIARIVAAAGTRPVAGAAFVIPRLAPSMFLRRMDSDVAERTPR